MSRTVGPTGGQAAHETAQIVQLMPLIRRVSRGSGGGVTSVPCVFSLAGIGMLGDAVFWISV